MSRELLDAESRALLDSALRLARSIQAEIRRLQARDFVHELPRLLLGHMARRVEKETLDVEALPAEDDFAAPGMPIDERMDTLATHVAELRQLHQRLSLLSRVHSSRLPFELVKPFEGLAAQLLGTDVRLLLRPFDEYGFCIRPWGGQDGLLQDAVDLENSFCVMCPSAEVSSFHLFAILGHELGHPIYQRTVKEKVADALGAAVDRTVKEMDAATNAATGAEHVRTALDLAAKWAEETFCDLVGVRIFGPSLFGAFQATLTAFWNPDGRDGYPSSAQRLASIHAALKRWWRDDRSLAPVMERYSIESTSRLSRSVHPALEREIASRALAPERAPQPGPQPSLFESLIAQVEAHVPTPGSFPRFADRVVEAGERITMLTPPDPYIVERDHRFESHELVAFAFISSGLGRRSAFDRWKQSYGWSDERCEAVMADLCLKGLEASDMQRRYRLRTEVGRGHP